jgi:hypothetical protein
LTSAHQIIFYVKNDEAGMQVADGGHAPWMIQ